MSSRPRVLDWTQVKLAEAAEIGIPPESNFEQGRAVSANAVQAMQRALEAAGIEFIEGGRRQAGGERERQAEMNLFSPSAISSAAQQGLGA